MSTSPAARYRIEVYRLGWYAGLGGRRMVCVPSCRRGKRGAPEPTPAPDPATGEIRAGWPTTDVVHVGRQWVSGYYLANLVLTTGPHAGDATSVPFIVRAPLLEPSRILVQAPVNTWQAYNGWGGKSLYGEGAAHKVSFDRPFGFRPSIRPLLIDEYPLVRFLERRGYDVSYTTNVDIDRHPSDLLHHRLFISVGHDEYWTKKIRDALERARELGTNLAFIGGNDGYWQARYADGHRTLVEYRSATLDPEADPALKTVRFRDLHPPRPECELVGVQGQGGINPPGMRAHDFSVVSAALRDRWFAGTGFTPAGVIPGIVGHEWDAVQPGCDVPPLTRFLHYDGPFPADAVRYTAQSGARVFAAGSIEFDWALDNAFSLTYRGLPADPHLERFMRNALSGLERPAPPVAVSARRAGRRRVVIRIERHRDPRVHRFEIVRHRKGGAGSRVVCRVARLRCVDHPKRALRLYRYAAYALDRWGRSAPRFSR